jgi:hypothetical protein
MSDSELQGGSPHLCRLRTDRLASVNQIELCADAYEIYGVTELDDTPLYFTDDIEIVFGSPTDYLARFSHRGQH